MVKHHRKSHMSGGLDWKALLSKGLSVAKQVKDSGLISKGLNLAQGVASALGKDGIADKLGTAQGFASSVGAGRKRKRNVGVKKLRSYPAKSRVMRDEVCQMDGANQLYGSTGAGRKGRMHGGAWYDDLWSGVKTVASTALPIAMQMAPRRRVRVVHPKRVLPGRGQGVSAADHVQEWVSAADSRSLGG